MIDYNYNGGKEDFQIKDFQIDFNWENPIKEIKDNSSSCIPPACRYCSNHPSNGGSGICWCIAGSQIFY